MATETNYIILWEYDVPIILPYLLNYEAGIWFWTLSPGIIAVTDDNGNTGYYDEQNSTIYNIQSLLIDGEAFSETTSLADCRTTNKSFYYDPATSKLYIHFDAFEPPLDSIISVGGAVGFSMGTFQDSIPYFDDRYYEPRISKIFNIKKSKDPLYYGLLKFVTGKIQAINNDGYFDDWKNRNLYAQATRILLGSVGDDYSEFQRIFSGFVENNSISWEDFSVTLQDIRAGFTRPVASNLLTQSDYAYLNDSNVDSPKPVAYGDIYNAPCICLNEGEVAATYTFLLCDTEFNSVDSLTEVLVDGVDQTAHASLNASSGTFTLSTDYYDPGDEVTASFTVDIKNGVDIIKDLILNYDDKTYLASFWDLTETNAAQAIARDTSVYIDDDTTLSDVIEQVCFDIDALFFPKDDGHYTVRIYSDDRDITKIIYPDEFIDEPDLQNESSQYLTSAIIKYKHNINDDTYLQYENLDYQDIAFSIYKRYKNAVFETNLTTLADAQAKSETILDYSSNVPNIVSRTVKFEHYDLEIMDFIVCSPYTRFDQAPDYGVYEVIGLTKNFDNLEIKLNLRYITDYSMPVDVDYEVLIDESENYIVDESGNTILMR